LRSGLYAQPQLPRPDTAVGQVLAERRASLVADLREVVIGFAAWRQATLSARTGSVVMGGRVLVVEDDEATRDSTLALLTSHGYEAVGANSGTTALALLRNGAAHPRLVLLDLHMPGMDG
jgi:PleD family two-component response regulator